MATLRIFSSLLIGGALAGPGVGHSERLQKVVDLVGGDRHLEDVVVDPRGALEIRDTIAVHDDAAERRVVRAHEVGARTTKQAKGQRK